MDEQLLRYFSGELTVGERLELIHRIENDSLLKAEFIRLQNLNAVWELSSRPTDRSEGIRHFKTFTIQVKRNTQRKSFIYFVKYAAIALVLVASTVWATLYLSDTATEPVMNTLYPKIPCFCNHIYSSLPDVLSLPLKVYGISRRSKTSR